MSDIAEPCGSNQEGSREATDPPTSALPAVAPARAWTDIELARRIGHMLTTAADKLGVPYDASGFDFEGLAREVILAAQGGRRLTAQEYRLIWRTWQIFRRPHREDDDGRH